MSRVLHFASKYKHGLKKTENKLFLSSVFIFFLIYRSFPQNRIGDGSEYILQYFGFIEGGRPWITPSAVKAYNEYFNSGEMNYLVGSEQIQTTFSALSKGDTFDLNHFWLYSGLAAALHLFFKFFLVELSVSDSFVLLHGILFGLSIRVAWKKYSYIGVMSALLLLFGSPLFWYGNKIHTEFFTFALVLLASILAIQSKYLQASISIALASTQNPSFAAIALVLIFLSIFKLGKKVFRLINLIPIAISLLLCGFHPAYYLWRQGVLTPQLKAGGASVGGNLEHFFLWLIDPDVGLFPNWPLGILFLTLGLFVFFKNGRPYKGDPFFSTFVLSFFLISLYAQSSTTNLNSGGTPGLARYALWYVGLFFPICHAVLVWLRRDHLNYSRLILLFSLAVVSATSMYSNAPLRPEQFTNPSISSRFIQTNFAEIYSPPMPIFVGRYSGLGEDTSISSVVGPDCRKIAIIADMSRTRSVSPAHCGYSASAIQQFVYGKRTNLKEDTYFKIGDELAVQLRFEPTKKLIQFSLNSEGFQILGDGWSSPEPWGVWTDSKEAEMYIPCTFSNRKIDRLTLTVNSFGEQKVKIVVNGQYAKDIYLINSVKKSITVNIPKNDCKNGNNLVLLKIPNSKSPKELGMGEDARSLGVGLIQIVLDGPNEY
jgi:hypothetical protein